MMADVEDRVSGDTSKGAVLLVATMASFLFPFVVSAVNIALPLLGNELSLDEVILDWVASAHLLSCAALLVPFGRIADIHGRKRIFTYGIIIFTVFSLLSGIAGSSAATIICFRALHGIGAAMIAATGVAMLTSVFPAEERGKALGINIAGTYAGLCLGSVLGGVLTEHLGWRSVFLINVPLGMAIIAIVLWKVKGEWVGAKGEKFDFAGSVIYSLAILTLLYGFTHLPAMSGVWLIAAGVMGLSAFARREMKAISPVLDMNLFRNNRAFTLSTLAALIYNVATYATAFLISLYLQYVRGFHPESTGLIVLAMPAMMAVLSPLAGKLSDRIEPRAIASAGMVLTTAGLVPLIFLTRETPLEFIIGALLLVGFGSAIFSSPNRNAIMSSAPWRAYGVASATAATMRQVGMALSMAVGMVMFVQYIGRVQITPEYYPAFLESMKTSFIIFAALCFGGIFVSLARGKIR